MKHYSSLLNHSATFLLKFFKTYILIFATFFFANQSFGQTFTDNTPNGNEVWTVPASVNSITVECWGAGGAGGGCVTGGSGNSSGGGGGGAGGAYASLVIAVTPGQNLTYNVGTGGIGITGTGGDGNPTWFSAVGTLFAEGGQGGGNTTTDGRLGGIGSSASSIGTTTTPGVDGSDGAPTFGGAGGAGAPPGGGAGGPQRNGESNGGLGQSPGGGGGGALVPDNTNHSGGNGGDGQVVITWTTTLPCNAPTVTAATSITSSSAVINWTAAATPPAISGYEYVVSTSNTAPGGAGTTGTSGLTETGLTQLTTYYIFVRTDCGGGNFSGWDGPISFSTPATPAGPANDACSGAISIPTNAACVPTTGSTTGATDENATGDCTAGTENSVWYSFVATGTGHSVIVDGIAGFDAVVGVLSTCGTTTRPTGGTCTDATNDDGIETLNLSGLTIGNTYYVQVHDRNGDQTANGFTICITDPPPPPGNDGCPNATTLTVNADLNCGITTAGTVLNATASSVAGCVGTADDDVWYVFQATNTAHVIDILNVTGNSTDMAHAVYDGTPGCGSFGPIVSCSDPNNNLITGLTIGTFYYIQVYTYTSSPGRNTIFDICVGTPPPPPGNNLCTNATPLTVNADLLCGNTTAGTVESATASGVAGCVGTADDDVWYSFVATSTLHHIDILNVVGNSTDMVHAVYDAAPGCGSLSPPADVCSDPNSSAITGFVPGNTYYIQVFTYTATTGRDTTFDICVGTPPPPPGNDDCSSPTALTVNADLNCGVTTAGTVQSASDSGIDNCFGSEDDDVWYSFVATSTVHWVEILNVAGNSTDMAHAIYDAGPCGSLGPAITCSDPNLSVTNSFVPGNTYYIQVYTYTATTGRNTTFDVCVGTPPPPPPNDECTGAYPLTMNGNNNCSSLTAGSVASATNSGETGCAGTEDDDVWFSFVATQTSHNIDILNISGTTTNLDHAVYAPNTTCANLVNLTCSSGNSSSVSGLTIGNTYYVQVYTWTATGGQNTSFDVCVSEPCLANFTLTTPVDCPSVVTAELGTGVTDPTVACGGSGCIDLEATYLELGETTDYTAEYIPYNPPWQFENLANPIAINNDDVWSPVINLPFNFCFYGNQYSSVIVGANGVISFNTGAASGPSGFSFSSNLPSTTGALFANSIYGVYHDVDPSVGGQIGWELVTLSPGCRALVAAWHDVPMYSNNSLLYTGMMVLYENTNVIEVYIEEKNIDGTWNGGNAIVGVQNSTASAAVVAPCRNALDQDWSATNEAWRFVPSGNSISTLTWYEGSGTGGTVLGNSNVLNVCPSTTQTYTAEVVYNYCSGGSLTVTDESTITVAASKTWDGSSSSSWNTAANWTPSGVPTNLDCVVIPTNASTPNDATVTGTNTAECYNLTVEGGGSLNVQPGAAITVTDVVMVEGGATFELEGSQSQTGSLIQVNDVANGGEITIRRDAFVRRQDYVYWSSPVANQALTSISPTSPTNLIYEWEATFDRPDGPPPGNTPNDYGRWVAASGNTTEAKGYIIRGPDGNDNNTPTWAASTFTGTPNNGDISIGINRGTYTGGDYTDLGGTVTNQDDNWNLVGNPYPSALDARAFLTLNADPVLPVTPIIEGTVYLWTHGTKINLGGGDPFYADYEYNYNIVDYLEYNLSGPVTQFGFDGFIGTGQGFFVQMKEAPDAGINETLQFNNSMRGSSNRNDQFFRTSEDNSGKNNNDRIWLDLVSPTKLASTTLVAYVPGATNQHDGLYDATTIGGPGKNLYTVVEDKEYIIQGRQHPLDINDQVGLGMSIEEIGQYAIAINTIEGKFKDGTYDIYVEDLYLGIIHDLKTSPYLFTVSSLGKINDRFILKYTEAQRLADANNAFGLTIIAPGGNFVKIASQDELIDSVIMYDLLGRVLTHETLINESEFIIDKDSYIQGAYIVKVTLQNGEQKIQKIVLK